MRIPSVMARAGVAELFRQNKVFTTTPLKTIVDETTYKLKIEISHDGRMEFTIWKSSETNGRKVGHPENISLTREATGAIIDLLASAILFEPSEENNQYIAKLELGELKEGSNTLTATVLVGNRNNKIYLSVAMVDSCFPEMCFEMNNLEN
ncbi:hypothetical protein [Ralstonia phage RP31]|uniref:Uncharacterized protein n=2 Tax=Ripduovirus RP12 TaxID=2560700 RepID=A0A1L7N130_9CAUD|nr:hypothetical protein FDH28_gp204 [Ralstonia phage RP12]BAW19191.1 hypothetical protein [Ralstonia phage RP12]BAW19477.1 hypothetical protein [Ralstonia phage RP31]